MSYELTSRTIALNPEAVATLFPALLAQYGEALPDGAESITTIGGHWDDSAQTRIRAASLHKGTITGQPLDRWPCGLHLPMAEPTSPLHLTLATLRGSRSCRRRSWRG
jgi:hypothetical protein